MINNLHRVTVLLPFYRVDSGFSHAIESICNQTFTDWRLLLVNNNADETGLRIAREWMEQDARIAMVDESVQGIAHALNKGLAVSKSEYVARMDADDISLPNRLQLQVDYLDNHPDVDAVSTQTRFESSLAENRGYALFVEWQNSIISPEAHALSRFVESPIAHPSIMFRKTLIDHYGPYDTGPVPEDYELWLRWMGHGIRFYKIPIPLVVWNDHEQRLSRNHENYSREAFYQVKCKYLAKWILETVPKDKKVVVCGSSKIGRKRADLLSEHGVEVYGFTDVKKRPNRQVRFIPYQTIHSPEPWFLVNFIAKRGVGESITNHFQQLGFITGRDFIMGA